MKYETVTYTMTEGRVPIINLVKRFVMYLMVAFSVDCVEW